ncbi:34469_t:CDS:2, partial [Gigaspora margarita]
QYNQILIFYGSNDTSIMALDTLKFVWSVATILNLQYIPSIPTTTSSLPINSSSNIATIIGGIFGGIAGLIVLITILVLIVKRYGHSHLVNSQEIS